LYDAISQLVAMRRFSIKFFSSSLNSSVLYVLKRLNKFDVTLEQ